MGSCKVLLVDCADRWKKVGHQLFSSAGIADWAIADGESVAGARAALSRANVDCAVISPNVSDEVVSALLHDFDHGPPRNGLPIVFVRNGEGHGVGAAEDEKEHGVWLRASKLNADAIRLAVSHAVYRKTKWHELRELQLKMQHLAHEARERNEELRLAKEEAERANAAKDDFLATLSHELRTPLTPVLSLVSSTLVEGNLSSDLRETFGLIQRNVELEARFIDDLLDLTQIASGRLALEKHPVDLHDCIRHALEICHNAFIDRRVDPVAELNAENPHVLGDVARIHQVLWNLLKNAVKFTPPGGRVTITTANDGHFVLVTVTDTGMGIEADQIPTIFNAFGGNSGLSAGTGPGLGLAIARAIVEAHSGAIFARSEGRNQGAAFQVRLPIAETPRGAEEREVIEEVRTYRGRTVLVIEDHEDTRRVLSRALRRRGFGVSVAEGVEAACEQFALSHPDLVICDLGLPDGTGWDALRRLRELGSVKAIAVSGFGMEEDVRKSRESGFVAHLTKPVNFAHLENLLATVLSGTGGVG